MKIDLREFDNDFTADITAETAAEAALLVRLGLNARTIGDAGNCCVFASGAGEVSATICLLKRKTETGYVRSK